MIDADVPHGPRRPLARQLAVATMAMMLALGVLVMLAQLRLLYVNAIEAQQAQLDDIGRTWVPSLAAAVWQTDPARTQLVLDGIARTGDVQSARLRTDDGTEMQRGDAHAPATASRRFTLTYREGRVFQVGTLEVRMGDRSVIASLRSRAVQRVVSMAISLVIGALALLWLVDRRVTRPLRRMAAYARALRTDTLHRPLSLRRRGGRNDELDEVARSINRMRETLLAEIAVRERHEAELHAHRDRLEDLVAQRTMELETAVTELQDQRDAIQRLADTDHLTGAMSRRRFHQSAERDAALAQREGHALSVLMIDIDHFKQINDRHGHAVGDRVIRACVDTVRARLRGSDCIGRLGGEEFAVLMPMADANAAKRVAQDLRESLSRARVTLEVGGWASFTVSIGVAELGADGLDALLRRADEALYAAKRGGRNRVVVAPFAPLKP